MSALSRLTPTRPVQYEWYYTEERVGSRSVRLDAETERALAALASRTGDSLSAILKRGILALRDQQIGAQARSAHEIYRELDLGPGGDTSAPARAGRDAVRAAIRKCQGRSRRVSPTQRELPRVLPGRAHRQGHGVPSGSDWTGATYVRRIGEAQAAGQRMDS